MHSTIREAAVTKKRQGAAEAIRTKSGKRDGRHDEGMVGAIRSVCVVRHPVKYVGDTACAKSGQFRKFIGNENMIDVSGIHAPDIPGIFLYGSVGRLDIQSVVQTTHGRKRLLTFVLRAGGDASGHSLGRIVEISQQYDRCSRFLPEAGDQRMDTNCIGSTA